MSLSRWTTAVVLLVSACAPSRPTAPTLMSPADLVVLGTAGGLTALNTADGRLGYQATNAGATPDWPRLVYGPHGGTLGVLDGRSGRAQESAVDVPPGLSPLVISNDGQRVALAPAGVLSETCQPSRPLADADRGRRSVGEAPAAYVRPGRQL